jgi:hypothetical protein
MVRLKIKMTIRMGKQIMMLMLMWRLMEMNQVKHPRLTLLKKEELVLKS